VRVGVIIATFADITLPQPAGPRQRFRPPKIEMIKTFHSPFHNAFRRSVRGCADSGLANSLSAA
jgi:hypothetical protein